MYDSFDRRIDTLRVSVTDRCDLRCAYCMPDGCAPRVDPGHLLTDDEIVAVVRAAVDAGVTRVRITGGEPLLRPGLPALVARVAALPGVDDLAMTTNGTRLAALAGPLAAAGLRRVNVSLDAVDPDRYRAITRGGDVAAVMAGIAAAAAAGLSPVKLNCVVESSPDEPDARAVAAWGARHGYPVRFIRRMEIAAGSFWPVEGGEGGRCGSCRRLRLASDGTIMPCLFSDQRYSVRDLGAAEAIRRAVEHKPAAGRPGSAGRISAIGG